jgi:hypothetical protein
MLGTLRPVRGVLRDPQLWISHGVRELMLRREEEGRWEDKLKTVTKIVM